jgi:hypothetical protein
MARRRRPSDEDELRHGDITFEKEEVEQDLDFEEEDEEDEDEDYEITPDDPDYDLSEEAGYSGWEPDRRTFSLPQWLIVALSLLLILALLVPVLSRFS